MKKYIFTLLSILFIGSTLFLGKGIYDNMDTFKRYKETYANELNFENTLLDFKDYLFESEYTNEKKESRKSLFKGIKAKEKATYLGFYIFIIVLLYTGLTYFFFRKKIIGIKQIGFAILNISVILLLIGISVPMLELGAFKKDLTIDLKVYSKTFDGKMYFFYQCKSILELIQILFTNHNFVVGFAILLFSIIAPVAKLIMFYIYLFTSNLNKKTTLLKIISYVGKYSMADVFVVANFLAYLSFMNMNVGVNTESSTLVGLYFFFGYCILSIGTYFVIKKKITEVKEDVKTVKSLDDEF